MKNDLMDSELDKLRNKELSFGCILYDGEQYMTYTHSDEFRGLLHGVFDDGEPGGLQDDNTSKIIGHPLTRGRIFMLYENRCDELAQTQGLFGDLPAMINLAYIHGELLACLFGIKKRSIAHYFSQAGKDMKNKEHVAEYICNNKFRLFDKL